METFDTSMGTARVKTDATFGFLKALGNRQGPHALACEYVGTSLAKLFGLPVADFAIVKLTPDLCYDLPRGVRTQPGPAFVSREVAGGTWDASPDEIQNLMNPKDVTRLVVFDNWVRNRDRHPPDLATRKPNYANVFLAKTDKPLRRKLYAIDHTHCFDNRDELTKRLADIDNVRDDGVYGLFPHFRPYIDRTVLAWCGAVLRDLNPDAVREIVAAVPAAWDVPGDAKTALVDLIVRRAAYLADRIDGGWGRDFWAPGTE